MLTPQGGPHEADDSSDAPEGLDHVSRIHQDGGGVSQGQRAASLSVGRGSLDRAGSWWQTIERPSIIGAASEGCLLYTSDAADIYSV